MHLVLYASDHGFGHAMRMLALAEVLCSRGVRITFCAGPAPAPVLAAALGRLTPAPALHRVELDAGLIARPGSLAVDEARSAEAVRAWLERLPRLIAEEAGRLRALAPDLVVADAPPVAVAAAAQAGVPAVVCSNFTWLDLYGGRFGDAIVRTLEAAYAHARLGLRLHPGSMPLRGVPADRITDVPGLLARGPRRSRAQVRAELGVPEDLPLLALGFGRSLDQTLPPPLAGATPQADGAALLIPGPGPGPGVPSDPGRGVFFLPADTPDIPDYLGAADAILAKAGYSTIAEGALGGVPLLLFPVAGNPETQLLCQQTQDAGWGLVLRDEAEALAMASDPARAIARAQASSRSSPHQSPAPAAPALAEALLGVLR
jgi:L-arabinokinase